MTRLDRCRTAIRRTLPIALPLLAATVLPGCTGTGSPESRMERMFDSGGVPPQSEPPVQSAPLDDDFGETP